MLDSHSIDVERDMAVTQVDLARRIRGARQQRGWSQGRLAEEVGLAQSAISRIETGERSVDSLELAAIARALRVSPLDLLEEDSGRVRLAARAEVLNTPAIEPTLARAEAIIDIERLLDSLEVTDPLARVERTGIELPGAGSDIQQGMDLAAQIRATLGLANQPIADLPKFVESRFGIDVVVDELPDGVAGLYVEYGVSALAMVDAASVVGRQRFTIAHEVGHRVCGDAADLSDVIVDRYGFSRQHMERRANAFAAHLLMPRDGLVDQINGRNVDEQVVTELEFEFGVSQDAMLWQLLNTNLITRSQRHRYGRIGPKAHAYLHGYAGEWDALSEQVGMTRPPARLVRRALLAYRRGLVGIGLVGELLGRNDRRGLRRQLADLGLGPESGWVDDTAGA